MHKEDYWFNNIGDLISNYNLIPIANMNYAAQVNTLIRLSIILGLILMCFTGNYLFLYIPIITMLGTYIVYLYRLNIINKPTLDNDNSDDTSMLGNIPSLDNDTRMYNKLLDVKKCVSPSLNNPFMNPLVFDKRNKQLACNGKEQEIEKEYNKYCIKDISDIWNHNSGRRQFYTVASTTYPNDQGGFANWLYNRQPTCKDGNGAQCVANIYNPHRTPLM